MAFDIQISFDHQTGTTIQLGVRSLGTIAQLLQAIVTGNQGTGGGQGQGNQLILNKLTEIGGKLVLLEEHLSKQDDKIQAYVDTTNANYQQISTALDTISAGVDNLAGDEANLQKQIADLKSSVDAAGDLTPENQAKLDAIMAAQSELVSRSAAFAKKTSDLADAVPDVPASPVA